MEAIDIFLSLDYLLKKRQEPATLTTFWKKTLRMVCLGYLK